MKKQKSEYSIQTVANALMLLEAFHDEEELGVTELSRRLDLHKNNVFRLLATLELQGYIEQSANSDRYRLGTRCLELGQSFLRSRMLLRRARPVLEELASRSGESSHLGVMRDFEVIHLDGAYSNQLVATGLRIGRHLPVHCTALGKVLLGCSPEEIHAVYDRIRINERPLDLRTPATIVDSHKLFDDAGEVVAALSVSGPSFRMNEERLLGEIVPLVTDSAARLSRELGFATPAS
jgi:DNA-binding IclR family transcriptional regulator